jgi:glutamine---fructose-6-phosphate transaminase (isomerizing)
MCGIVAIISKKNVTSSIIDGLKHLEYRGYDSAGVAVISNNQIARVRTVGHVSQLEKAALQADLTGSIGLGHTRWASHGGVTEPNAHPHVSCGEISVVHNGIIENYEEERERLRALGYIFESDTDTEVIAHLIHHYFKEKQDLFEATKRAAVDLRGAYSFACISVKDPQRIICYVAGCPLIVGIGEEKTLVASDVSALLAHTRQVVFLEDGDLAELKADGYSIFDSKGCPCHRKVHTSGASLALLELGPYKHFMQKEIHEQPKTISDTIERILTEGFTPNLLGQDPHFLKEINAIQILACGTSYYAGLVAKFWFESIARLPCQVEIASEYRYRESIPNARQLIITISQSGETRDTNEALKHAKQLGQHHTLSICNVRESAIPRASKLVYYTTAGVEIGVASTKAFTAQLVALFAVAVILAKEKGLLSLEKETEYLDALRHLPASIQQALNLEPQIKVWAERFATKEHALFLGRGIHYPIALEGALKLKEISYIHAEAYQAGELKHGPLALVDSNMPVVVIAPNDMLLEKLKSNMQEVRARGGELFVIADLDSHFGESEGVHVIRTLRHIGILSPVVHAIPMQLLAYHTGLAKGTDVDRPRNLAKSLTVE